MNLAELRRTTHNSRALWPAEIGFQRPQDDQHPNTSPIKNPHQKSDQIPKKTYQIPSNPYKIP